MKRFFSPSFSLINYIAIKTRATPAAATPATEQAAEFLLKISEHLIEVRGALIATITPRVLIAVTARFIPGHALLQLKVI